LTKNKNIIIYGGGIYLMKFELELKNISVSNDELINDIKNVAQKLNKNTVTMAEYNIYGKYHSTTLQKRFRSWFIVLQKAGLNVSHPEFNIDNNLLLDNIADIWIKLGRQPSARDMKKPLSKYGANTYLRHFNGWNNALKMFIECVNGNYIKENLEIDDNRIKLNKNIENEIVENSNSRGISLRLRFSVFLRDGFRCQSCGKSPITDAGIELHCDHIIPWSKGRKTIIDNLRTLCSECNLGKGNING
jgi:hypothetical protein